MGEERPDRGCRRRSPLRTTAVPGVQRAWVFLAVAVMISAPSMPARGFLVSRQGHGAIKPPTLLNNNSRHTRDCKKSSRIPARGKTGLRSVQCVAAAAAPETLYVNKEWQFEPLERPPLVRGEDTETDGLGLTSNEPRNYQVELFRAVMECQRNSLVYLPTGLGKTLVASMVLKRLLDLNPGRQAFFLVETTALAVQQTEQIKKEVGRSVQMLTGASVHIGGDWESAGERDSDGKARILETIREANIVVATAGAFEHAMMKKYIDPDSICCVVLDEAHHCVKAHPFNRVTRLFLASGGNKSASTPVKLPSELPKVLALTASPAGELTVLDTMVRIEELLDRLGAELVGPLDCLEEVKRRTPPVDLELVNVAATAPETKLLACLEKLVLSRVMKRAPEGSEAQAQVQGLQDIMDDRMDRAAAAGECDTAAAPRAEDDILRFPNKFFTALCYRALALDGTAQGGADWEEDGPTFSDDPSQLGKLMNSAFAVDEIGGEATWRWVLDELESTRPLPGADGESGDGDGDGAADDDPELEETIRVLKAHLEHKDGDENENVAGSKLAQIASLLEKHKKSCDASGKEFSALVFVSRRDLAKQVPKMLEAIPALKSFVKAEHIVGLSDMSLSGQRAALASFRSGPATVLVSTSVCGEGIDVPACALVVCASLPSSGTELVQLRGRLRSYEEHCRFVGLTRSSGAADQALIQSICARERNMLEAVKSLSAGVGSKDAAPDDDPCVDAVPMVSVTPVDGVFPPPCFVSKNYGFRGSEDRDTLWKRGHLPETLSPGPRVSSMTHMAACVQQAVKRTPNQNARSTLNTAIQLAQTIQPDIWYDEKTEPSWYDGQTFRARCLVSCRPPGDLDGLLLVKEARGLSLKAAREAAAAKTVQYLLWVSNLQTFAL
ncbi:unnamed protein product [Pylaiella littoralis]